jgi:DNA-binding transcriptional LysR family regulator
MDLHKLECFLAVVDEGTLSKAAAVLNMTQPPLSMMIRKLEGDLNVSLFDRSERQLKLTSSGKLLYQRAKALLESVEEIKEELIENDLGVRGTVNVGCSTSANLSIIPNIIKKLRDEAPNIVVRVSAGTSSYIFKELKNHSLDIGIVPVIYQAENYDITNLYSEPLLLALPPGHHLLGKEKIRLRELRNENFLLTNTSIGESISDQIIQECHNEGFSPNIVYWGTEVFPMILMVMKSIGITFAPASFREFYWFNKQRPHLVEMDSPRLKIKYSLVTLKNRHQSRLTQKFIDAARDVTYALGRD